MHPYVLQQREARVGVPQLCHLAALGLLHRNNEKQDQSPTSTIGAIAAGGYWLKIRDTRMSEIRIHNGWVKEGNSPTCLFETKMVSRVQEQMMEAKGLMTANRSCM